ncbi:hypothetical protein EV702DRAFT_1204817 [Suillus placidus]|uniref:DUF6533 domain-containing protein n=1 Tax=Suillus placidus TaxID=48579 RepID=A0A9P6ZG92_9AGAM|nr:hypothetical protein EV702DRAFT_1204817 [Suillus placidus]
MPHPDMTTVLNDPAYFPFIGGASLIRYFVVVSSSAVVYDWALTFGHEFELVWVLPLFFLLAFIFQTSSFGNRFPMLAPLSESRRGGYITYLALSAQVNGQATIVHFRIAVWALYHQEKNE